jgi:hypothetical protein
MVSRLVHLRHDDWDRPRCSICSAGRGGEIDLLRIEKLLADRAKLKAVAAKFGLKQDALRRHWDAVSIERAVAHAVRPHDGASAMLTQYS